MCENGKLRIGEVAQEMGCKEADYRKTSTDFFAKIKGTWSEIVPETQSQPYVEVIKGFVAEINGTGKSIADGREGRKSLLLSNAIYLSSWEREMVELPAIGSDAERSFEKRFESALRQK